MLRPVICTILGHVDAGKTLLLDYLRDSNVQKKETGGITQKIGTTFMSKDTIGNITKELNKEIKIPGIIWIDSPGHQVFTNLRICGLMISDIIILVVDAIKGIEEQTVECIKLLMENKRPFLIVANKIDRVNGWTTTNEISLKSVYKGQNKKTLSLLEDYLSALSKQMIQYGYNALPYYKNDNIKQTISIVPISAKMGFGVPDLLVIISKFSSEFMIKKLEIKNELNKGFIVDKMKDKKYGDLISCIITDGKIKKNDMIMTLSENNYTIESEIEYLYVPDECSEIKDVLSITQVNEVEDKRTVLIKLSRQIDVKPGSIYYIIDGNKEKYKELLDKYKCKNISINNVRKTKIGIFINGKTFSSTQSLGQLCNHKNIDISKITINNINKIDLVKFRSRFENLIKNPDDLIYYGRFLVLLMYDTELNEELMKLCETLDIKVIKNPIIYKLIEEYEKQVETCNNLLKQKYPTLRNECQLQIMDKYIFHKKDPLVFGVNVLKNKLYLNVVIECIFMREDKKGKQTEVTLKLGKVIGIQRNNKTIFEANENEAVCIKIESLNKNENYEYGRDFNCDCILKSFHGSHEKELLLKYPDIFK